MARVQLVIFVGLYFLFSNNFLQANCYKVVGNVTESTPEYVDVNYREHTVRIFFKKVDRKNLLPRGVTVQAFIENAADSKYITDYSSVDIMRRFLASSRGSFDGAKLTKDGLCLRKIE